MAGLRHLHCGHPSAARLGRQGRWNSSRAGEPPSRRLVVGDRPQAVGLGQKIRTRSPRQPSAAIRMPDLEINLKRDPIGTVSKPLVNAFFCSGRRPLRVCGINRVWDAMHRPIAKHHVERRRMGAAPAVVIQHVSSWNAVYQRPGMIVRGWLPSRDVHVVVHTHPRPLIVGKVHSTVVLV